MKKNLFLFAALCSQIFGQYALEDGIRSDNVLPAEASKMSFATAGSVDFHGDYSASIPLMTVPGRGGMDYPISLNYKSGITTNQRATWVGLGWNLNPGTITRIVNGIPDNINGNTLVGTTTENGAIENYAPYSGYGTGQGWSYDNAFPDRDRFDSYSVSIPGVISGILVPVSIDHDQDSTVDYTFQQWNGWRVSKRYATFTRRTTTYVPLATQDYQDILEFWLTDPNGTNYIFGLPLRSETVLMGGTAGPGNPRFIVEFVSNWQLTHIVSQSCQLRFNTNGLLRPNESTGSWVRFEYNYRYNNTNKEVRDIRPLYYNRNQDVQDRDKFGLLTQTTYLARILTPTHEAVFLTSPRDDISFLCPIVQNFIDEVSSGVIGDYSTSSVGSFIKPMRLDAIKLYRRNTNHSFCSFVKLEYASKGQELCRFEVPGGATIAGVSVGSVGKLTLKKVSVGDSTESQFYRFRYTSEQDNFNPPYAISTGEITGLGPIQAIAKHHSGSADTSYGYAGTSYRRWRSGRMGYLFCKPQELTNASPTIQNTLGSAAWSLRTIEYPTGAVDTIAYELDVFNKNIDQVNWDLGFDWYANYAPDESGIRVKYLSSSDPITGASRQVTYKYGVGHLPGLPETYLRNSDLHVGSGNFRRFIFGYNTNEVEYEWIETENSDGTSDRTYYTSVLGYGYLSDESNGYYNKQSASGSYVVLEDNSWYRGKPYRRDTYDTQRNLIDYSKSEYVSGEKYSAVVHYYVTNGIPMLDYYSKYIRGKLLSGSYWMRKMYDSTVSYENLNGSATRASLDKVTNYTYNNFEQVTYKITRNRQQAFRHHYVYAFEDPSNPVANTMFQMNILNPLSSKDISSYKYGQYMKYLGRNDSIPMTTMTDFHRHSFVRYGFRAGYGVQMDKVTPWVDDLNGDEYNYDNETNERVIAKLVGSFDKFGNPLMITDGLGTTVNLEWDTTYAGSCLTKRTMSVNGVPLTKKYTYNALNLLSMEEDENAQKTTYRYDGLGRLKEIIGPDGRILKQYKYHFLNSEPTTIIPFGYEYGIPEEGQP